MVVLEGGGMLSTSGNQYLQPDYLSPLPTTVSCSSLVRRPGFNNFFFRFTAGCQEKSARSSRADLQPDRCGHAVLQAFDFSTGEAEENPRKCGSLTAGEERKVHTEELTDREQARV
jgi:hypothetical protein